MLCIAHRGYSAAGRPENSMAAVEAAMALGVDGIEVDLWYLHGRFWMYHDRTIDIRPGHSQRLQDLSADELSHIRLANGEPLTDVPALLRLVSDRCMLNLELKNAGASEALARALDDFTLEQHCGLDHIVVSSFHLPELHACRQRLPGIRLGALMGGVPLGSLGHLKDLRPFSVNTAVGLTDDCLIDKIHRQGYQNWVYTANHTGDWADLSRWSVDAVFTDLPRAFMHYRESVA